MPTIIHKLEEHEEEYEMLHDMNKAIFFDGECYAFAIALHQGLGWPIVGLVLGKVIRHAGVQSPDGTLRDVRGSLTEEEFGNYFSSPPFDIQELRVDELRAVRPIHDRTIEKARQWAEVLWPDLPWLHSHTSKVLAFADELEALCRKHGFWIRSPVPASPPILYDAYGEEGGFELHNTIDGVAYTIDRYLTRNGH